jgi:hypothetical protein
MMRKALFLFMFLSACFLITTTDPAWSSPKTPRYSIMKFTPEQLRENLLKNSTYPRARSSALAIKALPATYTVLDRVTYDPATHNQGHCGNCWIWAGTTLLEVALNAQGSIADRLSTQFATSGVVAMGMNACCDGGTLWLFNAFYEQMKIMVPWANTGADYQSGDLSCVDYDSIATTPNHPVGRIDIRTLDTKAGRAEVIYNIKSLLNENKALWFAFFLAEGSAWEDLYTYWEDSPETEAFDFSVYRDLTWSSSGGGHAVAIVGYDEKDWIVLNSWGTAGGNRPQVLFRVPQDMDYSAVFKVLEGEDRGDYPMFEFAAIDVNFDPAVDPSQEAVVLEGDMDYHLNIFNDTATMSAQRIRNLSPGGRSGNLYLALWATQGTFNPDGTKYILARRELGELEGGQSLSDFTATEKLTYPPNGDYTITLVLSEWRADHEQPGETVQDHHTFPGNVTLTHNSSQSSSSSSSCFVDTLIRR